MGSFIPQLHLRNPLDKMKPEWCMEVVHFYVQNTPNYNLIHDKNVTEIEQYAAGLFDLEPFKKMFKSEKKRGVKNNMLNTNETAIGIDYNCFPLIPEKLNSARGIMQKIPIEFSCTAADPLAIEKKEKDINFLKNKPKVEAELLEVAQRMGIEEVDIGTTEHSDVPFSDSPFGLDLNEPDELDVFVNILYHLKLTTGFETGLQAMYELRNASQVKGLEIKDQLKFGISVNRAFQSNMTGLPEIEYKYPSSIRVPYSELPDFGDRTHTIEDMNPTVNELFNLFGSEIGSQADLEQIIMGPEIGYLAKNRIDKRINRGNFDQFRVWMHCVEITTIDWVGVYEEEAEGKKYRSFTMDEKKAKDRIWAQNTYRFYWLKNTKYIFGIEVLPFSHRSKGKESFQNFSYNIYKSQERSAVELSIGENKKAQIADIKLQHAVVMSLPAGKYIDLNFMRNALAGLIEDGTPYTMDDLLALALERNIVIGDTQDFEGKNDGQFKPIIDIPGGLRSEIVGYMQIMQAANQNINRIMGLNDAILGQNQGSELLVGVQENQINAGINSLYFCTEAIGEQYQKVGSLWCSAIKAAIEAGGKTKQAIIDIIGRKKANVIDGLDDVQLHDIGVTVKVNRREQERQEFAFKLNMLVQKGALSTADQLMIESIQNPKDKIAMLAVKEKLWNKKQDEIRAQNYQQQQQLMQQQGQNMVAKENAATEGEIKKVYAKGEVEAKIIQLSTQLRLNEVQTQGMIKMALQKDRNKAQLEKGLATLREKNDLEKQGSLLVWQ